MSATLKLIGATLKPRKVPFECEAVSPKIYCEGAIAFYGSGKFFAPEKGLESWRRYLVIDSEDFEKVKPYHWHIGSSGYPMTKAYFEYSFDGQVQVRRKLMYLHHFVLDLHEHLLGKWCVDHIDGNRLNNTLFNFRIVDTAENARHAAKLKTMDIRKLKTPETILERLQARRVYLDEVYSQPRRVLVAA